MKTTKDAIPPFGAATGSAACPVCGKTVNLKFVKEAHAVIPRFRWHRFAGGMCAGSNGVPPNKHIHDSAHMPDNSK